MRHIYFYNVHGCLYGSGLFAYISQNGKWTLGLYVVKRKKGVSMGIEPGESRMGSENGNIVNSS